MYEDENQSEHIQYILDVFEWRIRDTIPVQRITMASRITPGTHRIIGNSMYTFENYNSQASRKRTSSHGYSLPAKRTLTLSRDIPFSWSDVTRVRQH